MIRALEAVGVAWLMINVALFAAMKREDAMALSRRTIDRFRRAVGVVRSLPTASAADALIQRKEAIKRRGAGETLAEIAKSYAVDISMISRLS